MRQANTVLLTLAERLTAAYVSHTRPRAVLLVGSTAEGLTDNYSDIDMIAYYDQPPSEAELDAARDQIGSAEYRRSGSIIENYFVNSVECEIGHFLVADSERRWATVLEGLEVETLAHKALMGLVAGRPLHGAVLIREWQTSAAAFPEGLRRAMVKHYLGKLYPVWYFEARMARRDARLWLQQELVQNAFSILGILAGLNRLYFSPFQLKRTHRFVERMAIAPVDLADRIDGLFTLAPLDAVAEVEQLVGETLALIDRHLPRADTTVLRRLPGEREQPWS